MASLAQQIKNLKIELIIQGVMLRSIDDAVANRKEAEEEVRWEIRRIRKEIKALQNPSPSGASSQSSQPEPLRYSPAGPPGSWPTDTNNENGASDLASSSKINPNQTPAKSQADTSPSASTPNFTNSLSGLLLPRTTNLPSRKRSLSKDLDESLTPYDDRTSKSRRTTPSPYVSSHGDSPVTPAEASSGEDDLDFDPIQEQRAAEEQLRLEKDDEVLARKLQMETLPPQSFGHESSSTTRQSTGINAFERLKGIRPPNPSFSHSSSQNGLNASSNRKLPPSFKSQVKNEGAMSMASIRPEPVKSEPSSGGMNFSNPARPGMNQDPEIIVIDDDSNSDLEVVSLSAFSGNGREAEQRTNNQHYLARTQTYAAAGNQPVPSPFTANGSLVKNEALSHALFPGQSSQYPWMDTPSSFMGSSSSQNMSSTAAHETNSYHSAPGTPFSNHLADINLYATGQGIGTPSSDIDQDDFFSPPPQPFNGTMEQYDYIMNDPRKTTEEIKSLLENIQPDMDLSAENREGTPDGLQYPLYEHQKIALAWLKQMEEGKSKGGILADDMGLGKTISSIALIMSRPSTNIPKKTTLIVGPVSLVRQWEREIQLKVKPFHKLSTLMIHGQQKKADWDTIRNFDIVLTTYGTLGAEFKRLEKWELDQKTKFQNHYDQAPMRKLFPLLGPKSLFYRVVLDEAQCIKNKNTVAARACCQIKSDYRWCLTGTPMMNNVGELYSLIHFLRIKPYNEYTRFQESFKCLSKSGTPNWEAKRAMQKLQAVLKAILLRRTKKTMIDGKPIVELPSKTEEIQHAVFNDDELAFYQALESKTQVQFNKYMKAGTIGKNYSNVLVLLLRLRQCCCHPHLITDFEETTPVGTDISVEAMLDLARGLKPDVVGRLLASEGNFECPICLDAAQNPTIVIPCGHDTCGECLTKVNEMAIQNNVANGVEARGASTCPTCRHPIDMSKLIDYNSFKKVHLPTQVEQEDAVAADDGTDSDTDSDTESDNDANSVGDLRGFIVPDDDIDDSENNADADADSNDDLPEVDKISSIARKSVPQSKSDGKGEKEKRAKRYQKGKGKAKEKKPTQTLAELKKLATRSQAGRKKYMKFLRKRWEPSAKVDKCVDLLKQFQEGGHKTIIFSQFVSLLDLLQVALDDNKWACERYDGSMSADDRNAAIINFTDNPNCKIMLISLKAGNAGLNLVAASRVIILDPFWNPFIEMQAIDRAYRIGQQKPVEVHRILIKNTVEDRIIELQDNKRKLVDAALDEGASKSLSRLGHQELAFLFGVGGNH